MHLSELTVTATPIQRNLLAQRRRHRNEAFLGDERFMIDILNNFHCLKYEEHWLRDNRKKKK